MKVHFFVTLLNVPKFTLNAFRLEVVHQGIVEVQETEDGGHVRTYLIIKIIIKTSGILHYMHH